MNKTSSYSALETHRIQNHISVSVAPSPTPQIETPKETVSTPTYQASKSVSFGLTPPTTHRLSLMASERMLERAAQSGDTDGLKPKDLRFYSKNVGKAHARFDRSIKPKSPLAFLREKLFDD